MRPWIWLTAIFLVIAGVALAFVAASVNISKENSFVVLAPQSGSAVVSKEKGAVVLAPQSGSAAISKFNMYVVMTRTTQKGLIIFLP